jgi:Preprotein translocase subunit SecB
VRKKSSSQQKQPAKQYADFLKGIKLIGLALGSCSASLDRGLYFAQDRPGKSVRTISADYKLEDAKKDYFDASARFRLTVEEKATSKRALAVECEFVGHFHCSVSEFPRDFADRFTQAELRLILWPYFREFVNNITGKMSIPPVLIPLATGD